MMSSARKSIGERDAVAEISNSSSDDNEDTSESAETYEAARQLEDKKDSQKLLGSTSDADVSNFPSSDSIQTVTEADVDKKLRIGSKPQRSQKQNFERIKFKEECKVKTDDNDVSSDEKESKLFVKEDDKSHRLPNWDDIEAKESAVGCSTEQGQMFETVSKRTILDFERQVHCRYSPVMISIGDIESSGSSIVEKSSEVTTKKIISKSPEKLKKTRLGSSEIAADVIEDAIDPTDDSVFVGASDFITSNSIPNKEIVTDITEDAIDNTDQEVFTKISSDQVYVHVSNIISDTEKVTDVTKDLSDQSDETISLPVKFSDFVASSNSNIQDDEISHTSYEDTDKTVQVRRNSQTHDFQEVISGEIVSVTASTILRQVSQFESENLSDITAEPLNLQNVDIEKIESSVDSNPSDDRMEFSSASTIQSGLGYNTDIEKMECSSDTYSGFESFNIDGESNTTLEKMDCKSESSTSRDKMETDSLSLKSIETDGMEYSSDAMSSFGQKSISIHENESTSVQENEFTSFLEHPSIIVEENDSISVQEKESMQVHRNDSVVDQESKSIGVQEIQSTIFQENRSIDVSGSKVTSVPESKVTSVPESKVTSVQENESFIVQENESSGNQKNESVNNQQTAPISVEENNCGNILQTEDASPQLLDSVSSFIGDFVSRTIQETVSQDPRESLLSLSDEATVSQVLTDNKCTTINESDSSSDEIKSIYESTIDPNTGSGERNFKIPRQEASDTEEYDYEQKKVSKEVLDKNLSSRSELSLKRRNSAEDEKTGNTDPEKQSTLSIAELPNEDSEELKDSDDKKGHKKLKK